MIIANKYDDILESNEKRIAFIITTKCKGVNDSGFVEKIMKTAWPELKNIESINLGSILTKKKNGKEYIAICCCLEDGYTIEKKVVKECFDAIPGDEPVATLLIGRSVAAMLTGRPDFNLIKAGMEDSKKKIILYY